MNGLPETIVLSPFEVRTAVAEVLSAVVDSVVACLVEAPPELSQDVITRGIHLVGGGSLLRGLADRLSQAAEVPVSLVDAPLESVVVGAGRCLESFEDVQAMFME